MHRLTMGTDWDSEMTTAVCFCCRTSVLIDALDPTIQRWYLPQELFTYTDDVNGNTPITRERASDVTYPEAKRVFTFMILMATSLREVG